MGGSGLNRSFSVADMKMHVTSGGSGGPRSGSSRSGGGAGGGDGFFRPGMPQSVTHSASSHDLLTMSSAVSALSELTGRNNN